MDFLPNGGCFKPKPVSFADLTIMRRIDKVHLNLQFAGSVMLYDPLRQEAIEIGSPRFATLMKLAVEATDRSLKTSMQARIQKIHPYLLRKLAMVRANQVWITHLRYVPVAHTVTIVDGFNRKVLNYRVSNTLDSDSCRASHRFTRGSHHRHERPRHIGRRCRGRGLVAFRQESRRLTCAPSAATAR